MQTAEYSYSPEELQFANVGNSDEWASYEVEKPPSAIRKFVELMFYLITIITTYPYLLGLGYIPYALGSLLLFTGLMTLIIFKSEGQKLPASIWFVVAINAGVNFSQVAFHGEIPIIGYGLSGHFHWLSHLIMICYLVQNDATAKRIRLFMGMLVIGTVALGGTIAKTGRLDLEEVTYGMVFSDSNQLACMTGFLAVSYLFWSVKGSKVVRPILWILSALLVLIMFRTVSRSGILLFGCGLAVLVAMILMGRGVRLSGAVLIVVALLIVWQFGYLVAEQLEFVGERFSEAEKSSRVKVYSTKTLYELWETAIVGKGPRQKLKHAGITPHNSFVNIHLAYGGITAWIYMLWLIMLLLRIFRMIRLRRAPLDIRFLVVALFGMALGEQIFTNGGYVSFPTVYAVALIEKYTGPYTKRRIRERTAARQEYDYAAQMG